MKKKNNVPRREGDIVAIPLSDGAYGYGRVLKEPLMGFYDLKTPSLVSFEQVVKSPIAFIIFVMNSAVVNGLWPVIGYAPLDAKLLEEPWFFKKDPISMQLSIYKDSTGEEHPVIDSACKGLERAAVWEPEHVVDRLLDHFEERPNKWVESLRP